MRLDAKPPSNFLKRWTTLELASKLKSRTLEGLSEGTKRTIGEHQENPGKKLGKHPEDTRRTLRRTLEEQASLINCLIEFFNFVSQLSL